MHIKKIKALILVGGFGSRLRPLTHTIPKPLIPFVNIPILERQIAALSQAGVNEIILAMNYKYNVIIESVKLFEKKYKIKLIFSLEKESLGTAGPIAFAKKHLENDFFFVLNSDIICEFPFEEMIQSHLKNKKIGTLMVTEVKDPSKFGVIKINEEGLIEEFVEKPKEYTSNLINGGVYIFSPEILNCLEEKPSSIEKEIFPLLASEGNLTSYSLKGYWADIGTPEGYLDGQRSFLQKEFTKRLPGIFPEKNVVVGSNVKIGKNVFLNNCAIFSNSVIGDNVVIKDSIVGNDCEIGDGSSLFNFSVLGDDTKLFSGKDFCE